MPRYGHTEGMSWQWAQVSPRVRRLVAEVPQSRAARALARRATPHRLRILAFHGVPDLARFEQLLDELLLDYAPVSAGDVRSALDGEGELPRFPVWFTFDDGLPSTFQAGRALADRAIQATAFVCPAVLDTNQYLWFQVWERCRKAGLLDGEDEGKRFALGRLKALPDEERRLETDVLHARLTSAGDQPPPQADQAMLEAWVRQGHDLGNHTWDHPMLDQCSPEEQREQVISAHRGLEARGFTPRFLAYPNGNGSGPAADAAAELGYAGSLLFDHRLTDLSGDRHRLSRLRLDSDAGTRRAASVASGAHSSAMHLVPRL